MVSNFFVSAEEDPWKYQQQARSCDEEWEIYFGL